MSLLFTLGISACALVIDKADSVQTQDLSKNEDISGSKKLEFSEGHSHALLAFFASTRDKASEPQNVFALDTSGVLLNWDLGSGKAIKYLQVGRGVEVASFYEPDLLLAVAMDSHLEIISLLTKTKIASLDKLKTKITSLDFHPQGTSLVLGGADGRIYLWKFKNIKDKHQNQFMEDDLERYIGPSSIVTSVRFHPYGRVFFSSETNGILSAWLIHGSDIFEGKYDENVFGGRIFSEKSPRMTAARVAIEPIQQIIISNDGQYLYLSSQSGMLECWSVRGFKNVGGIQAHKGLIYDIALLPGGDKIASIGRDGKLKVWNMKEIGADKNGGEGKTKEFENVLDLLLPSVRKLNFVSEKKIIVGESSGRVLEVAL